MANNPPSTTIIVLPLKESVHEARLQRQKVRFIDAGS